MSLDLSTAASAWRKPLIVMVVAFAAGAQLAMILQALGGADYFGDELPLKLLTLALIAGGLYLLREDVQKAVDGALPRDTAASAEAARARLAQAARALSPPPRPAPAKAPAPRLDLRLPKAPSLSAPPPPAPPARAPAPPPTLPALPAPPKAPPLKVAVESPLARGPVWPPLEPLPVTVQVRGAPGEGVDVELELRHTGGVERARVPLKGAAAVLSQTVPTPGPFTLTARALWQGQVVAEASIEGVAASYREEIGRRFEALKANLAQAGIPVGAEATPREVRNALVQRYPQLKRSIEEVAASVEVALYSEEEVGRETYERLVRALAELGQKGMEAATRA